MKDPVLRDKPTAKVGRPKKTELDRLWDRIRQSLRNSAMGYMDIPHAQEFQVRATINIGPLVRELVDYELAQHDKQLIERISNEVIGEDEYVPPTAGVARMNRVMHQDRLRAQQRAKLNQILDGMEKQ